MRAVQRRVEKRDWLLAASCFQCGFFRREASSAVSNGLLSRASSRLVALRRRFLALRKFFQENRSVRLAQ
jgi:hypothetical protein